MPLLQGAVPGLRAALPKFLVLESGGSSSFGGRRFRIGVTDGEHSDAIHANTHHVAKERNMMI
jgi:hypothetical protein